MTNPIAPVKGVGGGAPAPVTSPMRAGGGLQAPNLKSAAQYGAELLADTTSFSTEALEKLNHMAAKLVANPTIPPLTYDSHGKVRH